MYGHDQQLLFAGFGKSYIRALIAARRLAAGHAILLQLTEGSGLDAETHFYWLEQGQGQVS